MSELNLKCENNQCTCWLALIVMIWWYIFIFIVCACRHCGTCRRTCNGHITRYMICRNLLSSWPVACTETESFWIVLTILQILPHIHCKQYSQDFLFHRHLGHRRANFQISSRVMKTCVHRPQCLKALVKKMSHLN